MSVANEGIIAHDDRHMTIADHDFRSRILRCRRAQSGRCRAWNDPWRAELGCRLRRQLFDELIVERRFLVVPLDHQRPGRYPPGYADNLRATRLPQMARVLGERLDGLLTVYGETRRRSAADDADLDGRSVVPYAPMIANWRRSW